MAASVLEVVKKKRELVKKEEGPGEQKEQKAEKTEAEEIKEQIENP